MNGIKTLETIDAFEETNPKNQKQTWNILLRKKQNELIRLYFKENLKNELSRGVFRIVTSPHYTIKFFWSLVIFISSSASAYLATKTIMSYLSFEVYTTTRIISETPTQFPKVTICNQNQFATK